jgi:hypothetical protein
VNQITSALPPAALKHHHRKIDQIEADSKTEGEQNDDEEATTETERNHHQKSRNKANRNRSNRHGAKRVRNYHEPRRNNKTTAKTTTNPLRAIRTDGGVESSASHRTITKCGYIVEGGFGLRGEARR